MLTNTYYAQNYIGIVYLPLARTPTLIHIHNIHHAYICMSVTWCNNISITLTVCLIVLLSSPWPVNPWSAEETWCCWWREEWSFHESFLHSISNLQYNTAIQNSHNVEGMGAAMLKVPRENVHCVWICSPTPLIKINSEILTWKYT